MNRRPWLAGTTAIALLAAIAAGRCAAQERRLNLSLEENDRWEALRVGKKQVSDAEKSKNEEVIRRMAQIQVNRMLDAAGTSNGSSDTKPVSNEVRKLGEVIIDPLNPPRRISVSQVELINVFGKESTAQLMKLIGTPEKPSGSDMLVKINAARMLSIVARSGYDGVGDEAVAVLADPKQHDAVKLYMLQALRNLFAVPNPDDGKENLSVFKKPESEAKAIQALIDFIARKPPMGANTPQDEVDGYRYLRREAVRALGNVRKPIVKLDDKIVSVPAIWLLRVANADKNLVPSPSLSERAEALAGYLELNPDRDENMDFAAGFVATAMRDLALEYKARKPLDKPKPDDKKPPGLTPEERDSLPWKLIGTRLSLGLKGWSQSWDGGLPASAKPAEWKSMMTTVVSSSEDDILKFIIAGGPKESITVERLNLFLSSAKFPSVSLFNSEKATTIQRPDQ